MTESFGGQCLVGVVPTLCGSLDFAGVGEPRLKPSYSGFNTRDLSVPNVVDL